MGLSKRPFSGRLCRIQHGSCRTPTRHGQCECEPCSRAERCCRIANEMVRSGSLSGRGRCAAVRLRVGSGALEASLDGDRVEAAPGNGAPAHLNDDPTASGASPYGTTKALARQSAIGTISVYIVSVSIECLLLVKLRRAKDTQCHPISMEGQTSSRCSRLARSMHGATSSRVAPTFQQASDG
jgi:hypothetical protein